MTDKEDHEYSREEDLGIKIGTKEEEFWTGVKEKTEKEIEHLENMIKLNTEILRVANDKIHEEQEKSQDV